MNINTLLAFALSTIICIYMCFANDIPDIANYRMHYELLTANQTEWLYLLLMKISKASGLSFFQFRCLCYIFGIVLLNRSISRIIKNKAFVLMLYMFYPFLMDVVQTRNFMAMALVCCAITNLGFHAKISKKIFSFILILMAGGIQVVSYVYLLIFIVDYIPLKFNKYLMIIWTVMFAMLVLLPLQHLLLLAVMDMFNLTDWRFSQISYRTGLGFYLYSMINLAHSFLFVWAFYLLKTKRCKAITEKQLYFVHTIALLSVVLLFFIPLYKYNVHFYRIFRNLWPLTHIVLFLILLNVKLSVYKKLFIVFYALYVLSIAIYDLYYAHPQMCLNILLLH